MCLCRLNHKARSPTACRLFDMYSNSSDMCVHNTTFPNRRSLALSLPSRASRSPTELLPSDVRDTHLPKYCVIPLSSHTPHRSGSMQARTEDDFGSVCTVKSEEHGEGPSVGARHEKVADTAFQYHGYITYILEFAGSNAGTLGFWNKDVF